MVVLIKLTILFDQMPVSFFTLAGFPEFLFDVDFQVRFRDVANRNPYSAAGVIFKNYFAVSQPYDSAAKVPLVLNRRATFDFREMSRKPLVIRRPVQPALDPGTGNFQCVSRVDEILHVQHSAQVMTHIRAIVVRDTSRLVNEHSDYRVAFRAGDFRVNQFDAVVDGGLLGKFLNALCNRPLIHDSCQNRLR
jgi:hypothetical protein